MRFIYIAVLFLAVVSLTRADSSEEVVEKIRSKRLRKLIKEHGGVERGLSKFEEACPGSEDKLKEAVVALHNCNEQADDSLTICESVDRYALNCSQPLITVLDECLPPATRGLARLGAKSIVSVVHYLCGLQGESIIELLNPCVYEDPSELTQQLEDCEQKVQDFVGNHQDPQSIPSPSEICGLSNTIKTCSQAQINQTCKNAKTRAALSGLVDAALAPCSSINEV